MGWFIVDLIAAFLAATVSSFRSRADNSLEVLAPRQQIAVFNRKRPRPALAQTVCPDRCGGKVIMSPLSKVEMSLDNLRLGGCKKDSY
jgi:hypothetical protein